VQGKLSLSPKEQRFLKYNSMRFTVPTSEELKLQAAKIGLPEIEAQKFFCYYGSNGWRVGKNKMRFWKVALSGWKLRWEERRGLATVSPTTLAILHQKELDEVTAKMRSIRGSYSEHQNWSEEDKARWYKLKARRDELKKLLGMQV
jgi:hypothetical protein